MTASQRGFPWRQQRATLVKFICWKLSWFDNLGQIKYNTPFVITLLATCCLLQTSKRSGIQYCSKNHVLHNTSLPRPNYTPILCKRRNYCLNRIHFPKKNKKPWFLDWVCLIVKHKVVPPFPLGVFPIRLGTKKPSGAKQWVARSYERVSYGPWAYARDFFLFAQTWINNNNNTLQPIHCVSHQEPCWFICLRAFIWISWDQTSDFLVILKKSERCSTSGCLQNLLEFLEFWVGWIIA